MTSVKISNISKERKLDKTSDPDKIFILIASFYSNDTAEFLKEEDDNWRGDIPPTDDVLVIGFQI